MNEQERLEKEEQLKKAFVKLADDYLEVVKAVTKTVVDAFLDGYQNAKNNKE